MLVSAVLLQIQGLAQGPRKQLETAPILGPLPITSQMTLLAPGQDVVASWGVSQQVDALSLSLSLSVSISLSLSVDLIHK